MLCNITFFIFAVFFTFIALPLSAVSVIRQTSRIDNVQYIIQNSTANRGVSRNLRNGTGPSRSLPSPLEVGSLKPARGFGERCKQTGDRGGAPVENEFGAL